MEKTVEIPRTHTKMDTARWGVFSNEYTEEKYLNYVTTGTGKAPTYQRHRHINKEYVCMTVSVCSGWIAVLHVHTCMSVYMSIASIFF